jgi:hypothetical protein
MLLSLLSRFMALALIFASQLVIATPTPNALNTVRARGELECRSYICEWVTHRTYPPLSN